MNGDAAAQPVFPGGVTLTEGPFAGWTTWSGGGDPYETLIGPFYFRDEGGQARCIFEPKHHHLNGGDTIHGGCLMSFADFALFAIAHNVLRGSQAVTMTFNSEFIGAGGLDGWVEAHGEVVRDTRSVVFLRGLITQAERPLLSFSGTLKKLARQG